MDKDLEEALDLLSRVDNYGIRVQMNGDWLNRLDALMLKYPRVDDEDEDERPPKKAGRKDEA
jgi:hypothetical protein